MPAEASPGADARIAFGATGAFRGRLPNGTRAHVDRALPFLILHRGPPAAPPGLAARVAETGSAYLVWPGDGGADTEALAAITAIARRQREVHDRVLLVSLYDLPSDSTLDEEAPRLEAFRFRVSASDDAAAQASAQVLSTALAAIEVDLRHPDIADISEAWFEPGLEALLERESRLSHLSLGLPQIHRVPGGADVYPQLLHELAVASFDALLQAFRAFLAAISSDPVPHHRALGRSSFIDAARSIDRRLDRISSGFDFLLGISPINSRQAFDQFKAAKFGKAPDFRYRPLTVDPDAAKRSLYAIDLRKAEDPVLEALFAEKRREIDQQLTMLQSRNMPAFRYASLMLYGPVKTQLLDAARDILARVDWAAQPDADDDIIGANEVRDAALQVIARYRAGDSAFAARLSVREDIAAGLMVSGPRLFVSAATRMRRDRLEALLQHEISVHLLTYFNGSAQGLKIFRTGLAGYEGIQEGLGVFAEYAVGGLTRSRLRLLAARVLVVAAMIEGAGFVDCFRLLRETHGFGARTAFGITARVFRSGGLAKDAIYLRGFSKVIAMLAEGRDLTPFWFGKIAAAHVPIVEELALRGLLHRPRFTPEFLLRPEAQARIAALGARPALSALI